MSRDHLADYRDEFDKLGVVLVRARVKSGIFHGYKLEAAHLWLSEEEERASRLNRIISHAGLAIAILALLVAILK